MNHSFDVGVAQVVGVRCAILLGNIYHWSVKNEGQTAFLRDGRYWSRCTLGGFGAVYPYLTVKQIRGALKKLVDGGFVMVGNFNSRSNDNTVWYSVSDEGLGLLENGCAQKGKPSAQMGKPSAQMGKPSPSTVCPKGQSIKICSYKTDIYKGADGVPSESSSESTGGFPSESEVVSFYNSSVHNWGVGDVVGELDPVDFFLANSAVDWIDNNKRVITNWRMELQRWARNKANWCRRNNKGGFKGVKGVKGGFRDSAQEAFLNG